MYVCVMHAGAYVFKDYVGECECMHSVAVC